MFTKKFWKEAFERAVKSAAQAAIGMWTLDGFNLLTADWTLMAVTILGGAGLSLLTSIVSAGIGPAGTPSVVEQD